VTSSAPASTSLRQDAPPTWQTNSALNTVRGIPWWAAVVLALAFTAIGVFADMERINQLGIIFQGCYFVGCVLAVLWVQRRGLFGPMVQPPLILAVTVPGVVMMGGGAAGGGLTAKALAVGTPLINGFPTMAITTGVTVAVGCVRLLRQRPPVAARRTSSRASSRPSSRTPPRTPAQPPLSRQSGRRV
jgi:uncharacterized protein DUF6542